QNGIPAFLMGVIIQRKHHPVSIAAKTGEGNAEDGIIDGLPIRIQQRIVPLLDPFEFMRRATELKTSTDFHRLWLVQKAVAGPFLDPEKKIKICRKRRRLPCLVKPVDDVEVWLARRGLSKVDRI